MEGGKNYIDEEKISLGYLIKRIIHWINFLLSKWLKIGIGALFILILITAFNYLKPKSIQKIGYPIIYC